MRLTTGVFLAAILGKVFAEAEAHDEVLKAKKPCRLHSSGDDCPAGCGACYKNYVTKMDFYHVFPVLEGPSKNWSYFPVITGDGEAEADDGVFTYGCHGGVVDSTTFTPNGTHFSPFNEMAGFRFVILADATVPIPKNGDLVIEFDGSAETFDTNQSPYPREMTQIDDVRMAQGMFGSFDLDSGLCITFSLTNDRVYAVYARINLPSRDPDNFYASFCFFVPVKMRNACDCHNMKVVWHGSSHQISWRLEGREVFRVTKVGYLLDRQYMVVDNGGQEAPVWPASVTYGFGTRTMLEGYPACKRSDVCCDCQFPSLRQALANVLVPDSDPQYNPLLGPPSPAVYYNTDETALQYYAWGQGAVVKINKLVVYQDYCAVRKC